ncbi:MAG: hypothetical protein ACI97A_002065 [Planctomycetota bacterium]|jgi:hypothetical protein
MRFEPPNLGAVNDVLFDSIGFYQDWSMPMNCYDPLNIVMLSPRPDEQPEVPPERPPEAPAPSPELPTPTQPEVPPYHDPVDPPVEHPPNLDRR